MAQALLTLQAERDLVSIWAYTAENSSEAANRLIFALRARCQSLSEFPGMGRQRSELLAGLRSITEGQYIIFYRKQDYGISVERIVHGSREVENLFPGDLSEPE